MKNNGVYAGGEAYDRIFRALGDPHRIQIIELLKEKERSAGEILEAIDVVQSTLSHHMKTLSDSGVVNAIRHGKWTYYTLNESNLAAAAAFLEDCARGTMVRKEVPDSSEGEEKNTITAGKGVKPASAGKNEKPIAVGKNEKQTSVVKNDRPSSAGKDEKLSSAGKKVEKAGADDAGADASVKAGGKKKEKDKKAKKGKKSKK